jgi:hypothetical protein
MSVRCRFYEVRLEQSSALAETLVRVKTRSSKQTTTNTRLSGTDEVEEDVGVKSGGDNSYLGAL